MGMTGRPTCPVVGSIGVIGGPVNDQFVGAVGENFSYLRHQRTGIAAHVGAVGEEWKTRWSGSSMCQCQNRYCSCCKFQSPSG